MEEPACIKTTADSGASVRFGSAQCVRQVSDFNQFISMAALAICIFILYRQLKLQCELQCDWPSRQ